MHSREGSLVGPVVSLKQAICNCSALYMAWGKRTQMKWIHILCGPQQRVHFVLMLCIELLWPIKPFCGFHSWQLAFLWMFGKVYSLLGGFSKNWGTWTFKVNTRLGFFHSNFPATCPDDTSSASTWGRPVINKTDAPVVLQEHNFLTYNSRLSSL